MLALDDPEAWQDLHAVYARAREADAVVVAGTGVVALRHAVVTSVVKDRRFGATDLLALYGIDHGPVWEWWRLVMASHDPPDHTRLRSTVNRAFTPRAVDALRPRIRAIASELLDGALAAGGGTTIDVIGAFANELPSRVMSVILGIPAEDRSRFNEWTTQIGLVFGAAAARDPELRRRIEDVLAELYEYVGELSADRRARPGEDLLSLLVSAEATSDRLSSDELAALVANLLFAGHDTTRSQLMIAFWLLASHPDQFAALRDGRDVVNATEEVLRYEPAVFGAARRPFEDVELAGVPVPAGTPVQMALVSASRDPRAYHEPDRFDVRRPDARPVDFGGGIHHCLGAALARAEVQETLGLLADRFRALEPVRAPRWVPYASIRRFDELEVGLVPA